MSRIGKGRSLALRTAALALFALSGIIAPPALAAEGERVFDPNLSLIGGCKAESLDPVEDPGCPTTPPEGPHPPEIFRDTRAVATDFHGNIYVASFGKEEDGSKGRIDIFDSSGVFIDQLAPSPPYGPMSLAIDSQGVLYVGGLTVGKQLYRYIPCVYEPEAGNIEYCNAPVTIASGLDSRPYGLAINVENDHLFVNSREAGVVEYSSAAESNEELRTAAAKGTGMAVNASNDRIYASHEPGGTSIRRIEIFDMTSVNGEDEYEKVDSIEEPALPGGDIGNLLSVAVDEVSGHVFVHDTENKKLYEFDEDGEFVTEIKELTFSGEFGAQIGVDNGPFSPNKGYLYVPSHKTGTGHSFAFKEVTEGPPVVKSA
ncbi:MAG TPA: hypothetical protein VFM51_12125, partial [Solirubrobacterales bacterium]|nr:hypothetical protein [Solirubrobacterales bacterium]